VVPAAQARLDGWKGIAAYLKRTTRTVQRWEKLEGLPIHRIGHSSSASVFAYPEEIDAWWNSRKTSLDPRTTPVEEPAPQRSWPYVRTAVPASMALLAIAAIAAFVRLSPHPHFSSVEVTMPVRRGNVELATISPDGKKVVYAWDMSNQHTLTLRDLDSGEERILSQGVYLRYYGLTFTRNGDSLYFVAQGPGRQTSALYRIPSLGGAEVLIVDSIDSPVSFSPADKRIAFIREANGESELVVANADGTDAKPLLLRKRPEYLDYPAWSPDGNTIVATFVSPKGAILIAVNAENGSSQPVISQGWDFIRFPVWLDRDTLAASVRLTRGSPERVITISYPGGKTGSPTPWGDRFLTLSTSLDGRSLAGVVHQSMSSIWTDDGSNPPKETLAPIVGSRGVVWAGNGRLLLGGHEVSSVAPDGSEQTTLMSGKTISFSAICGSNKLVYNRSDPPNVGLWQATLPGGPAKLLAPNWHEGRPTCSPDGEWALYSDHWGPVYQIPLAGGKEHLLIDDAVVSPSVSRDNQWIAAYRNKTSTWGNPQEIAIYPRAGGRAIKTFPIPPAKFEWTPLRWTRDNKGIGYVERQGGVANLWLQPVDGGPRRQITNFKGGIVGDFDWSPDGRLALELGTVARDVFVVRDHGKH